MRRIRSSAAGEITSVQASAVVGTAMAAPTNIGHDQSESAARTTRTVVIERAGATTA